MTRTASRKRYHHGRLRDAAIGAAVELVDEAGPEGLGLRELGRRLGVSHAAIHHHFATVDELSTTLRKVWFLDLDTAMAAAMAEVPVVRALERFQALGVGYVRYALRHPHRYRMLFRGGHSGLMAEAHRSFARVLECVAACAATAGRPIDPLVMTILAWSTMHGISMLAVEGAIENYVNAAGAEALAGRLAASLSELLAPR